MVGRVAVVCTLVAVLAGAAAGADQAARFAPRLRAELIRSPEGGPALVLDVSQATDGPALARVTFIVPPGQALRLPPVGTVVGDAAVALLPTTGSSRTPSLLAGRLVVAKPANAAHCVREPTGALAAALTAPRGAIRDLTLRLFAHVRNGSTRLTACLPRRDALAGRAAARRLAVRLVRGLGAGPTGTSVWRGLFTPVGKGGGAAAYPATTESRGIVMSPSFLTLQGPPTARPESNVRVRGVLSFGDAARGRYVRISAGGRTLARARTADSGAYSVRIRMPRGTNRIVLQARVSSRRAPCGGRTVDAPAGCTSATVSGVSSNVLRIRLR
jgi:hypothetical protein